jgi:hypothetical protein
MRPGARAGPGREGWAVQQQTRATGGLRCDERLATCKEGQGKVDGPQTEGKWILPGPWTKPELEAGTTDDPDR